MLGAVWTHQVSGLVVHSDGEGQQKKPNLESQLHCYRLLLFGQGSGPKVARAVHSPGSWDNTGELSNLMHVVKDSMIQVSHRLGLGGTFMKKMETITICRIIFFRGIAVWLNKNCIFCCSGKQNIYK